MHSFLNTTAPTEGRTISSTALSVLGKIFPVRIKRLMFVFSVLGFVDEAIEDDLSLIDQLNGLLRLPKSPDVCKASMQVKHAIWKDAAINFEYMDLHRPPHARRAVLGQDRDRMVSFFIDNCPKWLHYGDKTNDMRRDLTRLFEVVGEMHPLPA